MIGDPRAVTLIPAGSLPAWRQLADELALAGPVPCQSRHRDRWTSDSADDREAAAWACLPCPVIATCRQFADAARERHGVWAGVDRTPRPKRKGRPPATDRKETAA